MGLPRPQRPIINTVVFAGSVLRSSFPVRDLVSSHVARLVNDCGTKDNVLLAAQILIPFTGMAGRVGFIGMESDSFANRYFDFGHSDYFKKATPPDRGFMNKFWPPLFLEPAEIPDITIGKDIDSAISQYFF
jgi:hypothetical protein